MKFVFRTSRWHKTLRSSWGLRHWRSEFNYRYDGIIIFFFVLILWNLCGKPIRGRQKALLCYFLFFGGALIVGGLGVVGWDRKSYLKSAEIAYLSNRDFRRSNKHDTFWHVVSTGYFYVLFLWAIAISDFCPWEIDKNLGFPCLLSPLQVTATQIIISINIFICFKYYTVWNQFFIKMHVKVLTKVIYKHRSYFF